MRRALNIMQPERFCGNASHIVQPAGGQHEFPVTKPFGETDAGLMNITEAHTKSQTAGSKAFTGGGLLLCHDTKPQLL
jgi:hypothetical protein